MARLPTYPKKPHKSGQARIKWQGRNHYLGKHGSPESLQEFANVLGRITAALTREVPKAKQVRLTRRSLTIAKLCKAYGSYAKQRYNKNAEWDSIFYAMQPLMDLHAGTLACEFGPKALKEVRALMVTYGKRGWCRNLINSRVGKLRRMFRWAVAEELVKPEILAALEAVQGLRPGELGVRESDPVTPADPVLLKAILPYCNRQLRAMVRLQRIVGMRSGEVCQIRGELVDRTDEVWEFRPLNHKTKHRGKTLVYYFGRRAQRLLSRFIKDDPAEHWFSPKDVHRERHLKRSRKAKAPLSEEQKRRRRALVPERSPGDCYTTETYRRAINRAVKKFNEDAKLRPHQLRHSAGTEIRRAYGLEGSKVALGHSNIASTQLYAAVDSDFAKRIAKERG
jgi:integrase